jgi:hypothetical protein
MHISNFSSSESDTITSKKGEEFQTEQFESTPLNSRKNRRHAKELVVHTVNYQVCNDDLRNVWERFVSLMSIDSHFPYF